MSGRFLAVTVVGLMVYGLSEITLADALAPSGAPPATHVAAMPDTHMTAVPDTHMTSSPDQLV